MMKRTICVAMILVMLISLYACGTSQKQDENRPAEEHLALAYDFLVEYYTPNKGGRYDRLVKTLTEKSDQSFAALVDYFSGIQPYLTEEAFTPLVEDEILYKYDMVYYDKSGEENTPVKVTVSETQNTDGVYEIEYTAVVGEENFKFTMSGTLKVEKIDDKYKVVAMSENK